MSHESPQANARPHRRPLAAAALLLVVTVGVGVGSCIPKGAVPTETYEGTEVTPDQPATTEPRATLSSEPTAMDREPGALTLPPGEYVVYSRAEDARDQFGNPTTSLYALPVDGSDSTSWIGDASLGARLSPDRNLVAFTQRSSHWGPTGVGPSRLAVLNLNTGAITASPVDDWGEEVAWSPDGVSLIVSREVDMAPLFPGVFASLLSQVDTQTWTETVLVDCPSLPGDFSTASCQSPAMDPRGEWLAFALSLGAPGDLRQGVYLVHQDCASLPMSCFDGREGPLHIWLQYAWHPAGRYLAGLPLSEISGGRGLMIFDTDTMEWSAPVPDTEHIKSLDGLAWSNDGGRLALNIGPELAVMDIATGEIQLRHVDTKMISVEFWLDVR